jgi:hypothetical protein
MTFEYSERNEIISKQKDDIKRNPIEYFARF